MALVRVFEVLKGRSRDGAGIAREVDPSLSPGDVVHGVSIVVVKIHTCAHACMPRKRRMDQSNFSKGVMGPYLPSL